MITEKAARRDSTNLNDMGSSTFKYSISGSSWWLFIEDVIDVIVVYFVRMQKTVR